jgi:prepilin-type N-terminal cleavage/methylation domain-containing protein
VTIRQRAISSSFCGIERHKTMKRFQHGFTLVEPFDTLRGSKWKCSAFTLVELMVVIAINGILVALSCLETERQRPILI